MSLQWCDIESDARLLSGMLYVHHITDISVYGIAFRRSDSNLIQSVMFVAYETLFEQREYNCIGIRMCCGQLGARCFRFYQPNMLREKNIE